ncbi:MAG: putative porin [Flavobacteriaceae bacterium]|nr:putative porin [Flavobacteriaceae bacterium]
MKNNLFIFFVVFFVCSNQLFSQRISSDGGGTTRGERLGGIDTLNTSKTTKVILSGKTKYTDYKIFSHFRDTAYIDTTLTLKKHYKYNFLRKDNFELLQFHNQGQTYNNLGYGFDNVSRLPDIGFSAKQFPYLNVEDIKYYEVPTPTSEITYKTGLQQGQFVDAIFTLNFSRRLNVSLAYKGLRSLGAYRRSLVSSGNFRSTFGYRTKENQYEIRGHITTQDFFHEENGGLTSSALQSFIDEDPNFNQRSRLDVNLNDAENQFNSSRLYFEHSFKLLSSKDSVSKKDFTNLKVGHVFITENKSYNFSQSTLTPSIFGNSSSTNASNNDATSTITDNEFNLEFNSKYILGKFKAKVHLTSYSYGYDTILNSNANINTLKLRGNAISFGGSWNAKIKNFKLNANANITPGSGRLSSNFIKGEAIYEKDSVIKVKGSILLSSKSPNFNALLHQSRYDNYNWQNNFSNINTRDLGFDLQSKWLNGSVNFTNIDNYTYFDENSIAQQFTDQITYLKVKVNREFKFWKFALDNTLMYQNVSNGSSIFRVPEFITRNTFYYVDEWFKGKPMLVNIGFTFRYFTAYNMNAYNPLLAEFHLQNSEEIGFPTVDFFFNARVRRTRLYLQIDNVTSGFTSKNYFTAPNYPFRDFTIRFGVVWNWFI